MAATANITLGEVARLLALPVWLSAVPEVVGSDAALEAAGVDEAAAEAEGELAAALLSAAATS